MMPDFCGFLLGGVRHSTLKSMNQTSIVSLYGPTWRSVVAGSSGLPTSWWDLWLAYDSSWDRRDPRLYALSAEKQSTM